MHGDLIVTGKKENTHGKLNPLFKSFLLTTLFHYSEDASRVQ